MHAISRIDLGECAQRLPEKAVFYAPTRYVVFGRHPDRADRIEVLKNVRFTFRIGSYLPTDFQRVTICANDFRTWCAHRAVVMFQVDMPIAELRGMSRSERDAFKQMYHFLAMTAAQEAEFEEDLCREQL